LLFGYGYSDTFSRGRKLHRGCRCGLVYGSLLGRAEGGVRGFDALDVALAVVVDVDFAVVVTVAIAIGADVTVAVVTLPRSQ